MIKFSGLFQGKSENNLKIFNIPSLKYIGMIYSNKSACSMQPAWRCCEAACLAEHFKGLNYSNLPKIRIKPEETRDQIG